MMKRGGFGKSDWVLDVDIQAGNGQIALVEVVPRGCPRNTRHGLDLSVLSGDGSSRSFKFR